MRTYYDKCTYCKNPLDGRAGKKFCSTHCKSAFHNDRVRNSPPTFYAKVNRQLKLNRKILKRYNRAGKSTIRAQTLIDEGFNPNFFTHIYRTKKKEVYRFCYEFGFKKLHSNNHDRFLLITHQEYMN